EHAVYAMTAAALALCVCQVVLRARSWSVATAAALVVAVASMADWNQHATYNTTALWHIPAGLWMLLVIYLWQQAAANLRHSGYRLLNVALALLVTIAFAVGGIAIFRGASPITGFRFLVFACGALAVALLQDRLPRIPVI